jgi:hypothetical protein
METGHNHSCPECGKEVTVGSEGKEIRSMLCPYCGATFDIPGDDQLISKPERVFSTTIKIIFAGLVLFILVMLFFICSHANVEKLTQKPNPYQPALDLITWSWGLNEDGKTIEATGQVKNISDKPIAGVQAIVIFYNQQNSVVAQATTFIKDNLTPSQAYPFRITQENNPAMQKAGMVFLSLQGDTLRTEEKKDKSLK